LIAPKINDNIINEPGINPMESSLSQKCGNFNDINESFNNLKNFFEFQHSSDCFQNEFDLQPEEQELKILNEDGEYKLFAKSINKEFSSKYSRKKIF